MSPPASRVDPSAVSGGAVGPRVVEAEAEAEVHVVEGVDDVDRATPCGCRENRSVTPRPRHRRRARPRSIRRAAAPPERFAVDIYTTSGAAHSVSGSATMDGAFVGLV